LVKTFGKSWRSTWPWGGKAREEKRGGGHGHTGEGVRIPANIAAVSVGGEGKKNGVARN